MINNNGTFDYDPIVKALLYIVGFFLMMIVIVLMTDSNNDWKARECMDAGGIFNENLTDSSRSFCSGAKR